ncbi:Cilia- and flagella-associated protein 44, partial [Kappamyces sp. JEL0680]
EKDIHDEYRKIVGENNKNEEYLTKVFKRRVKRSKKKVKETEDGDDEEDDEEEEEDDLSSYNSDDDDQQEFEEACPADCDRGVWQRVLEIRERRLDQEEILIEVQKTVELLKKENDSLIKKEKIIDAAMKNAESEIEDFQTQKQRKLNELDVIVPLRFSQIQHLVDNKVPADLGTSLVFYNEGLAQLKRRIRELHQEKSDIKKQHRELKKQHVMFNKSKKEKEQRVAELAAKARDVQMLKFGQIVDLEKLEKLGVNKAADDLKEKLQREDQQRQREVAEYEGRIKKEKEQYMAAVKCNTEYLETIIDLQKQKKSLEGALNLSQTVITSELSGPSQKDTTEKEKLIVLVQNQAMQIEAIKAEIENLIRKPTSKTYVKVQVDRKAPMDPPPLPQLEKKTELLTPQANDDNDSIALDNVSLAAE